MCGAQEAIQEAVEGMESEGVEVSDLFEPMKAKYLEKQRTRRGCIIV